MMIRKEMEKLERKINETNDINVKTRLVRRGFAMFLQLFVWFLLREEVITKEYVLKELESDQFSEKLDEIRDNSIFTYEVFKLDGLNTFELNYEYRFDNNGICKKIIVG